MPCCDKKGNDVYCEFSPEGPAIINSMPRVEPQIFPYSTIAKRRPCASLIYRPIEIEQEQIVPAGRTLWPKIVKASRPFARTVNLSIAQLDVTIASAFLLPSPMRTITPLWSIENLAPRSFGSCSTSDSGTGTAVIFETSSPTCIFCSAPGAAGRTLMN